MGYIRADEILPNEVIELIQQYVNGAAIYVPRKDNERAGWGTINSARDKLKIRNQRIYKEYLNGISVSELSHKYYLSDKSIWRIIRKMKDAV